ncbi:MAG: hypothetical protein LBC12_00375 [Nitrososphaerota archaeon]|nr:hypothetical protein [Nitrososphaerota archaeon]
MLKISLKCPECGSLLKKDSITSSSSEEVIICTVCETQYKTVTNAEGKTCLEMFVFEGNDPGEL